MRKSYFFFIFISACLFCFVFIFIDAIRLKANLRFAEKEKKEFVQKLHLTDLCLFTEARYTRHISQADLHTAFQDHPYSLEHFPSGSLILPPKILEKESHYQSLKND